MPRILIVEDDRASQYYLQSLISSAGYQVECAPTGKEGLIEAWRGRPDLIVLDMHLPDLDGATVVSRLRRDHRTALTKVIGLSGGRSAEEVLSGLKAGLDAYVIKRAGADRELMARIGEFIGPTQPRASSVQPAKIISFLGAKGGAGTSSLCANLANELAELVAPDSVGLIDLALPIGSIAHIVGRSDAGDIVTLSRHPTGALNPAQVRQAVAAPKGWRFHVLAGSPDPQSAQSLNVAAMPAVMDALASTYPYLCLDLGRTLSRISLPILRRSHAVVLVLGPDLNTVALSRQVTAYLRAEGVEDRRLFLVLNRAVGLEGLSKAEIETQIGLPIVGAIPYLGEKLTLANNHHQPLAVRFPDDAAVLMLRQLAADLRARVDQAP